MVPNITLFQQRVSHEKKQYKEESNTNHDGILDAIISSITMLTSDPKIGLVGNDNNKPLEHCSAIVSAVIVARESAFSPSAVQYTKHNKTKI